jgi:membrane fusion protein (multidrug efflux system)
MELPPTTLNKEGLMRSTHPIQPLSLAFLVIGLFACGEKKQADAPALPPAEVSVVETTAQDVPLYLEFVGQTSGLKDIAIRARVEGFLEGMHFQEGSGVKKGDLLYTLESQPFEEKVASRKSVVAEAETRLVHTQKELDRIRPLAEINAVSQSDLDAAIAAQDAAISSKKAAEAQLRAAEIELGYTKIYSPIDGIVGKTKAKVGDFVGRDPNPVILNTVSRVDTILVTFYITETQYLIMARHLINDGEQETRENPSNMELILIDGSVYEHKGRADFVDREVDTTTGAMLVQASFPNPDKLLRPGQFTRVKIRGQVVKDGILVPQRCVMELQGLHSVFVVNEDNKVETRDIQVGPKIDSSWLVTDGLKPGEKVIYEGLQKARDGVVVQPTVVDIQPNEREKQ